MDDKEIIAKIKQGLQILFKEDDWLLKNDISEQSITHKLAEYLQKVFTEYNVDCEYNGNVDNPNGRKKIYLIKEKLKEKGLLRVREENDIEKEFTERAVFPDIIIHKRGTNDDNLCVIEVKKSTSSVGSDYDYLKLEAYTNSIVGNDLKYQLGIFILFEIEDASQGCQIVHYKEGARIN